MKTKIRDTTVPLIYSMKLDYIKIFMYLNLRILKFSPPHQIWKIHNYLKIV